MKFKCKDYNNIQNTNNGHQFFNNKFNKIQQNNVLNYIF